MIRTGTRLTALLSMAYGGVPVVKGNEGRTPRSSACPGKYSSGFGEGSKTRKADPKVALDDAALDRYRDTQQISIGTLQKQVILLFSVAQARSLRAPHR